MKEYVCKRCNKEFDNYVSLRKHSSRIHKIKSSDFYVEFYLNGKHPTCKCGCGENVTWFNGEFKEYKRGQFPEFIIIGDTIKPQYIILQKLEEINMQMVNVNPGVRG